MFGEGNFDSEGMGGAQTFNDMPGSGNRQSDMAPANAASFSGFEFKASPQVDYYAQLGKQLMQAQMQSALQQHQAQQEQPMQLGGGGDLIAGGFNQNWLADRLAAGSANGAKIGGMGK